MDRSVCSVLHGRRVPADVLHHDQDKRGRESMDPGIHCKEKVGEEER